MLKDQLASLSDSQQRLLLAQLLRDKTLAQSRFPMSAGQQGLWHAFRRNPNLTAFNVFLPTRIRGPLCADALRESIFWVARRHSALRTTFSDAGGKLWQIVHESLMPEFQSHLRLDCTDQQLQESVSREVLRPFCLESGPLMRVIAYQAGTNDWVVVAVTHHIIVDFWSLIIILGELRSVYPEIRAGRQPRLAPAVDNYRDFVSEQQSLIASSRGRQMSEYWQEILEQTPPVLELPTDLQRPAAFTHRAASLPLRISRECSQRIVRLAVESRSTPFAVVHSVLQVLLSRYSRQSSFFIGSPFSGRSNQKFEQTVGFFINMLPVKASVDAQQSFAELIRQTTFRLMETLDNEAIPIAEIVRSASLARDPSRSPLFQVSCTFERAQRREELGRAGFLFPDQTKVFDFADMHQESFYIPHPTCHYDLEFVFEQSEEGLSAMLIFCRDLFESHSMQQLATNFSSLLESLLMHPTQPLAQVAWNAASQASESQSKPPAAVGDLQGDHRQSISQAASQTISPQTISQAASQDSKAGVDKLIQRSIQHFSDQIALKWSGRGVTYRELAWAARQLADRMVQRGIVAEQLVPVLCRQGPSAFAGMLAVHLAGGAAVPVDLSQPSISIDRVLAETACPYAVTDSLAEMREVVSTDRWLQLNLSEPMAPRFHCRDVGLVTDNASRDARQLAYMIYTSGSTGQSKGVLVEHGSICHTLKWRSRALPLTCDDRILMLLSHQFDACLGIGWSGLAQAATLVWPDAASRLDPALLLQQIQSERITVLPIIPSMLRILANHPSFEKCASLRSIWTGGEALPPDLPWLIRSKLPVSLWNLYGPTEASVEATAAEVTLHPKNANMHIGKPIDGMEVLVLDSTGQPNPACVPGEIALAGPGLARGYFGDPDLTARRFVRHPLKPSTRLYLTGDLGRQLTDGNVEFLGRLDHQVKVRGYRVELGEIESVLESHPGIERAAVVVDSSTATAGRLVAYVKPQPKSRSEQSRSSSSGTDFGCGLESKMRSDELIEFLAARLSQYKLPSAIVILDELPLTSSGKVDRKRLPAPSENVLHHERKVPARNGLEQWLADEWCKELGCSSIGVHQNFFEAGGSSLQAAVVTTRMSSALEVHVPTALLFDLATIAQVARRLFELYPQLMTQRFGPSLGEFYAQAAAVESSASVSRVNSLLAPLKADGALPPLFMVHPPGGIVLCYRELAGNLPANQPLWAIRSRGLHGHETLPQSLTEMATDYVAAVRSLQAEGPYLLGGWSLGGLVAFEMAKQLIRDGQEIRRLVFLDSTIPEGAADRVPVEEQTNVGLEYGLALTLDQLGQLSPDEQLPMLYEHAAKMGILTEQSEPEVVERVLKDLQSLFHHHVRLCRAYRLEPIPVSLLLLRPQEVPCALDVPEDRGWRHLVSQVSVRWTPGHHHSMVQAPHAKKLAQTIAREIDARGPAPSMKLRQSPWQPTVQS